MQLFVAVTCFSEYVFVATFFYFLFLCQRNNNMSTGCMGNECPFNGYVLLVTK